MAKQLDVWLLDAHVGTLSQVDGRMSFAYAPAWLATNSQRVSLSQSLPLQSDPFDDRATRPFFEGLLPEGNVRKAIAQTLHVTRQNEFALLDGIGGECAGAITLLPQGQFPVAQDAQPTVQWLDDDELVKVLDEMPLRPMRAGDDGLRLSLAGAQNKLPVVAEADASGMRIGLPLFGSPSTHILKPPIASAEGSVFNEGFCMALAVALKLNVAKTRIHSVEDRHYLLVERYDRQRTPKIQRVHQEDFCQALGIVSTEKYQNEGGPSAAQAFALLRQATRPSAPQILRLLDAFVFNALLGNNDAHGKNFSLLYSERGAVLAPVYDVLCTAVYPQFSEKMAMKIGSKYKFSEVLARHWKQFAADAGLSPAQTIKRILDIACRLPPLALNTLKDFEQQGNSHPVLAQIVDAIEKRCELTIRRLTDAAEIEATD